MGLSRNLEDDGLLVVTLDEPARRNPLGHEVRVALSRMLSEAEEDDAVRAVVIVGAGGNFSAGGDISGQTKRSIAAVRDRFAAVKDLIGRMVRFPKPLIAAVEGWAAGGGFSLALACDTIVAAEGAKFLAPFGKIGLIPDMGILATLPARIGTGRARQILLTAAPVEAASALDMGLVDHLAPKGAALDMARELARVEMARAPLPRAFINDFLARPVDEALEFERQIQPILINSEDAVEGRAAFFEKRAPRFRGE